MSTPAEAAADTAEPKPVVDPSVDPKPPKPSEETSGNTETKTETKEEGKPPLAKHDSSVLDLAFAMDCTGSMGSYIHKAQQSIRQIVEEIVATEKSNIRLALVEYRDHPPQDNSFVTRVLDFTPSVSKMKKQLDGCSANGGGDGPEAVADALFKVSKLSWRDEATKICVFISDAPPHGLGASGDGFPNGCPDHHDPMEIGGIIAQKGITMYMVGCEPAIVPYRDFFMTIAHMTGGQYVPLANAQLLAKVIIGGAQEEITLEHLMRNMEAEIEEEVMQLGGWERYEEHADEIESRVQSRVNARGFKSKQLQMRGSSLPEASAQAKKWAGFKKMSDIKKEFKEQSGASYGPPGMGSARMLSPMMASSAPRSRSAKKGRGGMFSFFRSKGSDAPSAPAAAMAMPMGGSAMPEMMDEAMDMMEAPSSMYEYNVAEKEEIDVVQTKRMMQKFRNKKM